MRLAVTGATGFIGRHVVEEALRQGHEVCAAFRSVERSRNLTWLDDVTAQPLDLAYPEENPFELLRSPDVLIHLAWSGLSDYYDLDHFRVELPRQFEFLSRMRSGGLNRMLVAGTCLEYGMIEGRLSETQTTAPTTPYGFAKDALRRELEFLQASNPFTLVWTRLFYVYGDCINRPTLYTLLKSAAKRGDISFPMSLGEQIRDFICVKEAARNIVLLATQRADIGVVNVCSGKPISVRRQVEQWMSENNWNLTLDLGKYSLPRHEPFAFWGDNTRLGRLLSSTHEAS